MYSDQVGIDVEEKQNKTVAVEVAEEKIKAIDEKYKEKFSDLYWWLGVSSIFIVILGTISTIGTARNQARRQVNEVIENYTEDLEAIKGARLEADLHLEEVISANKYMQQMKMKDVKEKGD